MAKVGIDSFLLSCHTNDNISEIEAMYGVKGFAIVVRLWQKIYSEKGYYCEWVERSPLLFLSNWFGGNSGVTVRLITDIVNRCLKNGIFDAKLYENYSILTSERIQTQYFDVVKRRESIFVKKEYLLVSVAKIKGIAYEDDISVCRNQKNVCRNDTSKVKESKVKQSKVKGRSAPIPYTEKQILIQEYGAALIEEYIKRTTQYHCCNSETIRKWIEEDKKKHTYNRKNNHGELLNNYGTDDIDQLEQMIINN